jgi:hypothetical protein
MKLYKVTAGDFSIITTDRSSAAGWVGFIIMQGKVPTITVEDVPLDSDKKVL